MVGLRSGALMAIEATGDPASRLVAVAENEIRKVVGVEPLRLLDELVNDGAYEVGKLRVTCFEQPYDAHLGDARFGERFAERDLVQESHGGRHRRDDDRPAALLCQTAR